MPYDIVVLIKQIPDLELIKVNQETGEPITDGVPFKFENLSKNSVEAAVRIKEKNGGKITAVLFGNEKGTQVMKEAYAMGVDEGVLITCLALSSMSENIKNFISSPPSKLWQPLARLCLHHRISVSFFRS